MNVDGSLNIEAWNNGFHLHHTVLVCWPHSTKPSGIVSMQICRADPEIGHVELIKQSLKRGIWR